MVGYEDQVAANLIYEGFPLEGLAVMKAIRDRHNGRNRNPYSQLQAGNYYARSLANYSVLLAATGFRYSAVERCLWLDPKIRKDDLKTFFATAGAWGTLTLKQTPSGHRLTINVVAGELSLKQVVLFGTQAKAVDVTVKPGATWELECGS
jgi:non-lysosomal glucosylceramidase